MQQSFPLVTSSLNSSRLFITYICFKQKKYFTILYILLALFWKCSCCIESLVIHTVWQVISCQFIFKELRYRNCTVHFSYLAHSLPLTTQQQTYSYIYIYIYSVSLSGSYLQHKVLTLVLTTYIMLRTDILCC